MKRQRFRQNHRNSVGKALWGSLVQHSAQSWTITTTRSGQLRLCPATAWKPPGWRFYILSEYLNFSFQIWYKTKVVWFSNVNNCYFGPYKDFPEDRIWFSDAIKYCPILKDKTYSHSPFLFKLILRFKGERWSAMKKERQCSISRYPSKSPEPYLSSFGFCLFQGLHQVKVVQHVSCGRCQFPKERVFQVFQ